MKIATNINYSGLSPISTLSTTIVTYATDLLPVIFFCPFGNTQLNNPSDRYREFTSKPLKTRVHDVLENRYTTTSTETSQNACFSIGTPMTMLRSASSVGYVMKANWEDAREW